MNPSLLQQAIKPVAEPESDMNTDQQTNDVPMWAILELMGHVKTGALISKDTQFGTAMLRADVPQSDGSFITQLVNPSSIYRLTFCAEPIARACAKECAVKPMEAWELRHLLPAPNRTTSAPDPLDEGTDDFDGSFDESEPLL